ncbi:MAG: hypothetical protein CVU72_01975 [Deltaproteobacteria bacterium HGW-Deltaproteobacteria-7]|nr:MAG: hypothetical protein CVU72_01975 [Deltaproteobacteria bacterium HGW-Deltaproteobacteria-7]
MLKGETAFFYGLSAGGYRLDGSRRTLLNRYNNRFAKKPSSLPFAFPKATFRSHPHDKIVAALQIFTSQRLQSFNPASAMLQEDIAVISFISAFWSMIAQIQSHQ